MTRIVTRAVDETEALGEALGRAAFAGTILALEGELGAGKTALARGIGRGLGVTSRVQSPTYALVQVHEGGRLPFSHADLYRLEGPAELDDLELEGLLDEGGVLVVEWADRFPEHLPADRLRVRFTGEGDERYIELQASGPRHRALEAVHV